MKIIAGKWLNQRPIPKKLEVSWIFVCIFETEIKIKINRSSKGKRTQFTCEVCPKWFDTETDKNEHILEHLAREFCAKCDKSLIRIGNELYVLHSKFTCVKTSKSASESEYDEPSTPPPPLLHIETIIENEMHIFKEEPEDFNDDWSNHGDSMVDYECNDIQPHPHSVIEPYTNIDNDHNQQDNVKSLEESQPKTEPESLCDDAAIQNDPNELMAANIKESDDADDDDHEDTKDHNQVDQKPILIEKRIAQRLKRRLWKNNYDAMPVKCTVPGCEKMFKRRTIYSHMASHRGVRYECAICSASLATKKGLSNHMQKHYPTGMYEHIHIPI